MLTQPLKFGPTQLTTAAAAIVTSAANVTTTLTRTVFTNITGGAITITVNVVRSGGSVTTSNEIISAFSISAGEAYVSDELAGMILAAGDAVYALASANTSINVTGSGYTN